MESAVLPVTAIGLMSGTSLDGVDAAILTTDGIAEVTIGARLTVPYSTDLREDLRRCFGHRSAPAAVEQALTDRHLDAVIGLLDRAGIRSSEVGVIGFHGQTIHHDPAAGVTIQIGDGRRLAKKTGIDVVADFRTADVAAGGQGAPLAPLYHAALAQTLAPPIAVLNLGGVGNVTWIGAGGEILAFDTGPANALLDDWAAAHTGMSMDEGGRLAGSGQANRGVVATWLNHPFFATPPPKSLDRQQFQDMVAKDLCRLSPEDGAATLLAFTAGSVAGARRWFPVPARRWLVCGGGRKNPSIMAALSASLECDVAPVETVGWDGDALEAQAFAYLAVRALRGLPLSLPRTTGVREPLTGGRFYASGIQTAG